MIHIGVDPGLSGAVAKISPQGLKVWRDFANLSDIANGVLQACRDDAGTFINPEPVQFAVEQVGARPAQGVVSTFNFGKSTGVVLGALYSVALLRNLALDGPENGIDTCLEIHPAKWQFWIKRRVALMKPIVDLANCSLKNPTWVDFDSRIYVCALFPDDVNLVRRVKDHNTADAILLATYSWLVEREVELAEFVTRNAEYVAGRGEKPQLPGFK